MTILYVLDAIVGFVALYALACIAYSVITYEAMDRAYKKRRERRAQK